MKWHSSDSNCVSILWIDWSQMIQLLMLILIRYLLMLLDILCMMISWHGKVTVVVIILIIVVLFRQLVRELLSFRCRKSVFCLFHWILVEPFLLILAFVIAKNWFLMRRRIFLPFFFLFFWRPFLFFLFFRRLIVFFRVQSHQYQLHFANIAPQLILFKVLHHISDLTQLESFNLSKQFLKTQIILENIWHA